MAEAAAAILGIIGSSATCLEACIKGLAILSKARCYHRDVSGISLMFELEMHKLYAWGVEVGLTQQTQALLVDAQSIETVFKVLKHLESLVTDLDKLRRAHGLELQETTEQVLQLEDNASALGRLRIEVAEGLDRALNRMFKGRKEPWKVLKWVSFDQPRAKGLIDEIGAFVHQLQQILDQDRQRKLVKGMDMLLRNAVLNSANEQDLDMIGHTRRGALTGNDVAAAARFKKQGLLLGVVNTRAESVERFDQTDEDRDALKDRLGKVSLFLKNLDDSFHGLSCRGYVRIHDRYAYVLSVQDALRTIGSRGRARSTPEFRTLRRLLEEVAVPSLNLRLTFAITLLETTLQLHTSGWLHKEIRSENVVLVAEAARSNEDFLQASMRITGYVYARADDQQEMTEPVESERIADLYRHPASIGELWEPFRRAFDAFSVGCVLLELGLWCTLAGLFRVADGTVRGKARQDADLLKTRHEMFALPPSQTSHFHRQQRTDVVSLSPGLQSRPKAAMGESYAGIVDAFIHAAEREEGISATGSSQSPSRDLLSLELESAEKLRSLIQML